MNESQKKSRGIFGIDPNSNGFTLIELMIVVAIIAIIAAISIPNLVRSRMIANEGGALGSVRTISSAEAQYQSASIVVDATGMGTYGTLAALGANNPPFVDSSLMTGTKAGYGYFMTFNGQIPGNPAYQCTAIPVSAQAGIRRFYVDNTGLITFTADGSVPGPLSAPAQ